MRFLSLVFLSSLVVYSLNAQHNSGPASPHGHDNVATYSIVARDPDTGDLGVAVQSKFLGVGAVVPWAKAGVGAIATQAYANTQFGEEGLRLLSYGLSAQEVVDSLIRMDSNGQMRQLGIVDAKGGSFAHTGSGCIQYAGSSTGSGYTVQGNILAGAEVVTAIARTFELSSGDLADRLLEALDAGERAGGDKRGRQSAALLVVRDRGGYGGLNDRFIDIRVDDHPQPLIELRRIYNLWKQDFLFEARIRSIEGFKQNRNFTAAEKEMQRIVTSMNTLLRDKPDNPDVLNSVAWALATNDIDHVRALELAKRASKLAPSRADILDTLAECHYRLGHFDEAIAIETELAAKNPANDGYWKQLQKFKDAKQKSGK